MNENKIAVSSDLISRSALLKALGDTPYWMHDRELLAKIAPAVDAIPVVRCRDCKYFTRRLFTELAEGSDGGCYIIYSHGGDKQFIAKKGCDYCSLGEKKDGEQERTIIFQVYSM